MEIWIVQTTHGAIIAVYDTQEKAYLHKGDSEDIEVIHTWVNS